VASKVWMERGWGVSAVNLLSWIGGINQEEYLKFCESNKCGR
jgi:hypothetical protein